MEVAVVGGLALSSLLYRATVDYRANRREMKDLTKKWNYLMMELKLYSKTNQTTFRLDEIKKINNGYIFKIYTPSGLNYTMLEANQENIESSFKCISIIEKVRFTNYAIIKIINKDLGDYKFKPVKTYPNQLFIGKKFDGSNYFIDITKASHILIGGATGTGKSFLLASILTNLIYNSSNSIEIHLSQIMKGEIGLFKNCKPIKFVGMNLKEVALDLQKMAQKVNLRSQQFTALGVKNLQHYNKHYPKSKMKRIYYVIEEISFFMPSDTDNEDDKELKSICWDSLLTIVKAGRSSGIHLLSITQRSTTSNIPSNLKSQMCRITLKQISKVDSTNIIECPDATDLGQHECLAYGTSDTMEVIKVPIMDEDFKILQQYVKEILTPQTATNGQGVIEKDINNTPILVNNGQPKELPLYIQEEKNDNIIDIEEVAITNNFKKNRKGRRKA